ncbi:hypothetical protein ACED16_05365 [Enterobacter hormaechei]
MKLTTFKKSQQLFSSGNKKFGVVKRIIPVFGSGTAVLAALLISGKCFGEFKGVTFSHHPTQLQYVTRTDLSIVGLPLLGKANFLHQHNGDWISNSIEFFEPVSLYSKPVAEPGSQTKSYNRPGETNQGRISIEQKNELIPDGAHSTRQLLLVLLTSALTVFPLGVYLSLRSACKRNYARGISAVKVPVLGLFSVLIIPRKIKNRRWQIWEQRQWFRDMRLSHGIEVAYRDTWHWKKLVAGLWG